jgi:hypothetical protein
MNPAAVTLTEQQAAAALEEYQRILRLQDWRISVRICAAAEIDNRSQAQINWHLARRSATIRLLCPADYLTRYEEPQDMEVDLVHELCHIHLIGLNVAADTPEDLAQEQAIEALSEAVVALRRRSRPCFPRHRDY